MIQPSMWLKALRIIPRLTRPEWDTLDIVSRWLIITRAAVFIMTALSCLIGVLWAWREGGVDWLNAMVCLVGLVFAHATNNLVNDWTDHRRGIDKDNYYRAQYGPQPLEHGLLTERQMFVYIAVTGAIAAAAGAFLVWRTGLPTLALMGAGAFFVLFYTWPLKYIGMGEPTVLLVWGPLMTGGSYLVASGGRWSWDAAMVGLLYALGPTTVLFGKHTDKLREDRARKVYTMPVIMGEKAARFTTIGLWIAQYVLIAALVAAKILTPLSLAAFLALPWLWQTSKVFAKPRPETPPEWLPPNVWPLFLSAHAFVYNRRFGLVLLGVLIADSVIRKAGILG